MKETSMEEKKSLLKIHKCIMSKNSKTICISMNEIQRIRKQLAFRWTKFKKKSNKCISDERKCKNWNNFNKVLQESTKKVNSVTNQLRMTSLYTHQNIYQNGNEMAIKRMEIHTRSKSYIGTYIYINIYVSI